MTCIRSRRLAKEIKDFKNDRDLVGQVWLDLEDEISLDHVFGFINGPRDTPFAGGSFRVRLDVPVDYPMSPPKAFFITPIYHCNISSSTGFVCLDTLTSEWSASITLKGILLSLQALLQEPQVNDPQDAVVARQMVRSMPRYVKTAQYWTMHYATLKGTTGNLPKDLLILDEKVKKIMVSRRVTKDRAIRILSNNNWRCDPLTRKIRPKRNNNATTTTTTTDTTDTTTTTTTITTNNNINQNNTDPNSAASNRRSRS